MIRKWSCHPYTLLTIQTRLQCENLTIHQFRIRIFQPVDKPCTVLSWHVSFDKTDYICTSFLRLAIEATMRIIPPGKGPTIKPHRHFGFMHLRPGLNIFPEIVAYADDWSLSVYSQLCTDTTTKSRVAAKINRKNINNDSSTTSDGDLSGITTAATKACSHLWIGPSVLCFQPVNPKLSGTQSPVWAQLHNHTCICIWLNRQTIDVYRLRGPALFPRCLYRHVNTSARTKRACVRHRHTWIRIDSQCGTI